MDCENLQVILLLLVWKPNFSAGNFYCGLGTKISNSYAKGIVVAYTTENKVNLSRASFENTIMWFIDLQLIDLWLCNLTPKNAASTQNTYFWEKMNRFAFKLNELINQKPNRKSTRRTFENCCGNANHHRNITCDQKLMLRP